MRNLFTYCFLALLITSISSCYSFRGISIPEEAKTFTVIQFDNYSVNVVPTLAQTFSEDLKRAILSQTRLSYAQSEGDLEFSGAITEYSISPIAPQAGATSQFSRLQITVEVTYFNAYKEDDNWTSRFSRFADYESTQNFTSIQDALITDINDQIIEDIFNRAFTNW
ncbi:MAG: LPS assembly lipoprotein LptE [Bacteroidota bacterium]